MPIRSILTQAARIGAFAAGLAASAVSAEGVEARIEAVGVQLVYQTSGTLSQDIAPPARFTAWNTVIGEGDAREPANDIVVSVRLSIPQDQGNGDVPLVITVRKAGGKVVASRRVATQFFTKGRSVQTLNVQDATCLGKLAIEARLGKQTKSTQVALMCGE